MNIDDTDSIKTKIIMSINTFLEITTIFRKQYLYATGRCITGKCNI